MFCKLAHAKSKWCQTNEHKNKMEIIASHHTNGSFRSFWREVNRLSLVLSAPLNVEGKKELVYIANQFLKHLKFSSPLDPSTRADCYDVSDLRYVSQCVTSL